MKLGGLAFGATMVHSAACVLSDICDKDFDAKVGEHDRYHFVRIGAAKTSLKNVPRTGPLSEVQSPWPVHGA